MGAEFVTLPAFFQWVIALAAFVTALYVLYRKVVFPIADAVKRIHGTYEKVMEYDGRIAHVEDRAEQLVNNGGSSLRDAVDRIEFKQAGQAKMFADHIEWSQGELLKVWQNLASRDTVQAAQKTAEMIANKEGA